MACCAFLTASRIWPASASSRSSRPAAPRPLFQIGDNVTHIRSRAGDTLADLACQRVITQQHSRRAAALLDADNDIIHIRHRRIHIRDCPRDGV